MSVVALKNAVVSLVSDNKKNGECKNEDEAPLLRNGNNSSNGQYGSSEEQDLESGSAALINSNNTQDFISDLHNKKNERLQNDHNGDGDDSFDRDEQTDISSSAITRMFGKIDPRIISDLIIGLSDGLTVPFALTAGLSSLGDAKLVITGGFAELISGTISMGLGGYLGAKSEADYFKAQVKSQKSYFFNDPTLINHQVEDILLDINENFSDQTIISFIKDLQKQPELMVDFIIKYGKGLEEPDPNRQFVSAATIGGGYFVGGLVPLVPYFFVDEVGEGLILSIIVMAITLFLFGYVKIILSMGDECSLQKRVFEGFQMMAVGGVAAASAWFFVRVLG